MNTLFCFVYDPAITCAISVALILIFITGFFLLAIKSNLLRDEIDNPAAFVANAVLFNATYRGMAWNEIPRPFSLAKTQFAVWTLIVGSVYLHHMLCTDTKLLLAQSATTLALLGISAGTTGLSNVIDKNDIRSGGMIPRHQNGPSQGFLYDILSDETGISVHRFQNVIWTITAIAIYLTQAAGKDFPLPALDGTLLTLSGISNSAYLALKVNENKA